MLRKFNWLLVGILVIVLITIATSLALPISSVYACHASRIELEPLTASNPVETEHTLTVTVYDENDNPFPDQTIGWTIESGPGDFVSIEDTTDAIGQAQAVITSTVTGTTTVRATVSSTLYSTATKTWFVNPVILVNKAGPAEAYVGDNITYIITVEHDPVSDGSSITNLNVFDDLAGTAIYTSGDNGNLVLDPGEVWTFEVDYTIQPTGPDPLVNTATASGLDLEGDLISASDTHSIIIKPPINIDIDIEKEVSIDGGQTWIDSDKSMGPTIAKGSDVYFRFTITNVGNVTLTGISLIDSVFDLSSWSIPDLVPGEMYQNTYGPVSASSGQHSNTAAATGYAGALSCKDNDTAYYFGTINPVILVNKAGPAEACVGDIITYIITVEHDPASDGSSITNINVSDNLAGTAIYTSGDKNGNSILEPGEAWTFEVDYTIQSTDPDPLVNIATASGLDLEGDLISASDTHSLSVPCDYIVIDLCGLKTKGCISTDGRLLNDLEAKSPDGLHTFTMFKDTKAVDTEGNVVKSIVITKEPKGKAQNIPANHEIVDDHLYYFQPSGITFDDKEAELSIEYDPNKLPEKVASIYWAYYSPDREVWEPLKPYRDEEGGVAETRVTGVVPHFTYFAVLASIVIPPDEVTGVMGQRPILDLNNLIITPSLDYYWETLCFVEKGGESVVISVDIINFSSQKRDYNWGTLCFVKKGGESAVISVDCCLYMNEIHKATEEITIEPRQKVTVSFPVSDIEPGSYSVVIGGLSGEFTCYMWYNCWLMVGILSFILLCLIIWFYLIPVIKSKVKARLRGNRISQ